MSLIFRALGPSPSTTSGRAARLIAVLAAAALVAGCGSLANADPSVHSRKGVITGTIRGEGGVCPRHGCGPQSGQVTVFTPSGQVVAHEYVRQGHRFRFLLPAGQYKLNAGKRLKPHHLPYDCPPRTAVVRPSRTTHLNVHTWCGVP